ncbi:MAG: ATP-binding protein [Candidatus Aminicenantes bacterium]|nr:ATP-binding protein [Candidatus Aminicenantes bacterium]
MKLARLRLRNFRCFQEEMSIILEDITVLIGKNDSGKSTIMDALDLFLNDINPDKDDASKGGNPKDLTIICEFSDLPDEVVLDDANPTRLSTELLLNADGRLEIHKVYSGDLQKPKCRSIEAYAIHPTVDGAKDLLQFKNADLKKHAMELSIDLKDVDQRVNAQLRARIREHLGELKPAPSSIQLNEENAKKVWTELRKYLPAFALFKSDRASTDQDPEAQDPLKAAVKEAIKAKEAELSVITEYVQTEVQKIANSTLEKLHDMDPTLATQLNPTFTPPKWDSLFKASITSDDDIPINKRGSGVKRLILLNFFRAKAEQLARETGHSAVIYGIEEPETCQHPNNQRMLLRALSDLSSEAQVIISTHTPMLARSLPDSCLRYIHIDQDKSRKILMGGAKTNEMFAKSLGVLPDNTVKLFIGVEGQNDIAFLQAMASVLRKDGFDVLDLEKLELDGKIIFFPLGGTSLLLWSSRLANLKRPEFHLCDRDVAQPRPPKYEAHINEVNARDRCKARSTAKKEIENYLHKDAIITGYKELGITLVINSNFGPFDDVPRGIARLVHEASGSPKVWDNLPDVVKGEKESKAKRVLCSRATKHMTKALLDDVDPDGDLLAWFEDMKNLITK